MRNLLFISGCILCMSLPASAQEEDRSIVVDAKIWDQTGDTSYCHLLYINQYYLQFGISETDTAGALLHMYSPKDLAGFTYSISKDTITFISMPNPEDMGRIYLRKVYEGKYSIFQYTQLTQKGSMLSFEVSYYLWDKQWLKPPISKIYETEALLYHFSNCPELEYKIKTGAYGLGQIEKIVKEYESCDLTDEYEFFFE